MIRIESIRKRIAVLAVVFVAIVVIVLYGGKTLIDLTGDTVTADKILKNFTAHDKSGVEITGTCEYDVNSSDATVAVAEMLEGKTAYARGSKLTGTMPNNGAVNGTISTKAGQYTIVLNNNQLFYF